MFDKNIYFLSFIFDKNALFSSIIFDKMPQLAPRNAKRLFAFKLSMVKSLVNRDNRCLSIRTSPSQAQGICLSCSQCLPYGPDSTDSTVAHKTIFHP